MSCSSDFPCVALPQLAAAVGAPCPNHWLHSTGGTRSRLQSSPPSFFTFTNPKDMLLPEFRAAKGKCFLFSWPCWVEMSQLWAEVIAPLSSPQRWQPLDKLWGDMPLRSRQQSPATGRDGPWGQPGSLLHSLEEPAVAWMPPMKNGRKTFQHPNGEDEKVRERANGDCFALVLFIVSTLKETDSSHPCGSLWNPLDGNAGWDTNGWLISFFLSFFSPHILTFTSNC